MFRRILKITGYALLVVLIVGGYFVYRIGFGTPFTIGQLANRQAIAVLFKDPELLTQVGLVDGSFLDFTSGKLTPIDVARRDQNYADSEKYLKELHKFDRSKLSLQDQITFDILEDFYKNQLALKPFAYATLSGTVYAADPMTGTNVTLPGLLQSSHQIKNRKTAETYIERLEATAAKIDAVTTELNRQAALGLVPPKALIDKDLLLAQDMIAPAADAHPFVTHFTEASSALKYVDDKTRKALRDRALEAVKSGVIPAYKRLIVALQTLKTQAPQGMGSDGLGHLKDGVALYAVYLKQNTTTDYTPDQIHNMGLSEVARIGGEMDVLLKGQGLKAGTLAARLDSLNKRPDQLYENTDAGRAKIIARYNDILSEVNARMPDYFATVPTGKLTVRRELPALEKGAAGAHYEPAALDGSRPGAFVANLRDVSETPIYTMKTLAYHEGIPGHHFQIDTALHLKDMPLIRQMPIYSAYTEGWALYAERFASEIGLYKNDPLGDIGRLQAEMFRAVRLVVDTGIHAKGWSREQAIAYMVANTGMSETESTTEIERYMAMPGQACAYKIGQLKILELREKAKRELGPKFDLKAFHKVVLENGAVPLNVLERLVDDWITRAKA